MKTGSRHRGQNTSHDQQADAIADAKFVNLLADPHQKHRTGGHRQHGSQLPSKWQCPTDEVSVVDKVHDVSIHVDKALNETDEYGGVSSILVDFLLACFAFFFQSFQSRHDAAEQLENDRRGNIGHNAQAENRDLIQLAGAKHRHLLQDVSHAASTTLYGRDLIRVNNRQRNLEAEAIDGQQTQCEQNLLP